MASDPVPRRRVLKVDLTPEGRAAWDRIGTREGVTMTALLEALGEELVAQRWRPTARVVERARQIDRDRRSR